MLSHRVAHLSGGHRAAKSGPEVIRRIAEAAFAGVTVHTTWFPVNADTMEAATWAADALGRTEKRRLTS